MENKHPNIKKIVVFEAILSSFVLASTLYFWFLQPLSFISKQRLLIALIIWIILIPVFYAVFSFFQHKRTPSQNNLILGLLFSLLLCALLNYLFIDTDQVPYNFFLLPQQNIVIEIEESNSAQTVELTGFHNGLAPVSYSSLELVGDWQRNGETILLYQGTKRASLRYSGWMVADHFLEFTKNSAGGEITIRWNDSLQYVDLYSANEQKLRLDYPFSLAKSSKNSVIFLTFTSTFILLFPLIQAGIDQFLKDRDLVRFDIWITETTPRLKKFTLIISIIFTLATILLLISPYINTDKEATQIQENSSSGLPNIFIIIVDALTAEDMSLFGYQLDTTPNLNQIAQSWTVYTNAHSPSVCSIGVYPSLLTGHYPYIMRPFAQYGTQIRSSDTWIDLFQVIDNFGYNTYWSGYLSPGFYHTGSGLDHAFATSYPTLLQHTWFQVKGLRKSYFPYIPLSFQQFEVYDSTQSADDRLSQTIQLVEEDNFESPFFLYLHYDGVHVLPGIEWIYPTGSYTGTFLSLEEESSITTDADLRLQYDEAILDQDNYLKEFIEELKAKDLYENSMIIIMADHGQAFKEGQLAQCSLHIALAETHVPLLIKYPYQDEGVVVSNIVSTIDLTPTILDVLDIQYDDLWFDGVSLLEVDPNQYGNRYVFSGNTFDEQYQNILAIMDDSYKLVFRNGQYFLYDYKNDPLEENDLYAQLKDQPFVQDMLSALSVHREKIFE